MLESSGFRRSYGCGLSDTVGNISESERSPLLIIRPYGLKQPYQHYQHACA